MTPERHIVHLTGATLQESEEAVSKIQRSLGSENVIVLLYATEADTRTTLCVRATLDAVKATFQDLAKSWPTMPAVIDLPSEEVRMDHGTRRIHHEL